MNATPAAGEIWSVTQLTQQIQVLFTRHFPPLWIEGEISNYSKSAAGHRYFTLKDDKNQVRAALFRNHARKLQFEPRDGQKVLVFGTLEAYGARSEYQVIVQRVMPTGVGELELAFKQLHARLEKEGLFDRSRKKPLPEFPARIGVVTSARGAAVRDILKVLGRRAPQTVVVIAPVLVQGEGAAEQIAAAIELFNRARNVDVLIIGRGGGSLEDLWPFNEERTVRAVANSKVPTISAVGHEVDTTLCDLAADLRAPTPSAAAEVAVIDRREWLGRIGELTRRLMDEADYRVTDARERLGDMTRRYGFRRPQDLLNTYTQTTDALTQRLMRAADSQVVQNHRALTSVAGRPELMRPEKWLRPLQQRFAQGFEKFSWGWTRIHQEYGQQLTQISGKLDALSPHAVLERGYALVFDDSGRVMRSVGQTETGRLLTTWLSDGKLKVRVEEKESGKIWP